MASGDIGASIPIRTCRIPSASYLICKIVQLMRDPMSTNYTERQMDLLGDFLRASPCGFWVCDLPDATELIEMILCKLETVPDFEPYLKALLEMYGLPPLLHRFTEVIHAMNDIVEYFSFYGYIIVNSKDIATTKLAFKSLERVLEKRKSDPICAMSLRVCHEAIERSDLPRTLSVLLEMADSEYYLELLNALNIMATISDDICLEIIRNNAIINAMNRMVPDCEQSEIHDVTEVKNLLPTVQLLGVLVKSFREAPAEFKAQIATPSIENLHIARLALQILVLKGKKCDRNHFLIILLWLIECFPEANPLQSMLVKDFCILGVATELGTSGTWAAPVKFECNAEDYEFKNLLLLAMYVSSKQFGAIHFLQNSHVIPALLKVITPGMNPKWDAQHMCILRLNGLIILERLIPLLYHELISKNGVVRILMLLDFYKVQPYSHEILIAALKCLFVLLRCKEAVIHGCFDDLSILEISRNIIGTIINNESLGTKNQIALTYAFSVMSLISPKSNMMFHYDIDMGLTFMKRSLNLKDADIRCDPKLMISSIYYMWWLCAHSDTHIGYFVDMKGVYVLLDIIDGALFPVQVAGLGFLVDLCEESSCIPYLVTWRNKKQTLMNLMLRIFREENNLIGVKTSKRGVIKDALHPLMGVKQSEEFAILKDDDTSPAITDMDCSARPKIYAIIQLLNNRHEQKTKIAQEYYKIYDFNLTLIDQITKVLSENYLALKMGEAWSELKTVLAASNITLAFYDRHLLDIVLERYRNWGQEILKMQTTCLHIQYKNDYITEENFYNLLRESKLQSALDALLELHFLARTTDTNFRRKTSVFNLTRHLSAHDRHSTKLGGHTTDPVGQKMTLQSDVIHDPFVDRAPHPVSPISDAVEYGSGKCMDTSNISLNLEPECHKPKEIPERKRCH